MSRARPAPTTVLLLCRGCCCGTRDRHPGVDHDAQRNALERAAAGRSDVEVRVVDCLDECDRSNVAVIRRPGQPARSRDTWLGGLLSVRATAALAGWLADGAVAALPPSVAGLTFRHHPPPRRR